MDILTNIFRGHANKFSVQYFPIQVNEEVNCIRKFLLTDANTNTSIIQISLRSRSIVFTYF